MVSVVCVCIVRGGGGFLVLFVGFNKKIRIFQFDLILNKLIDYPIHILDVFVSKINSCIDIFKRKSSKRKQRL